MGYVCSVMKKIPQQYHSHCMQLHKYVFLPCLHSSATTRAARGERRACLNVCATRGEVHLISDSYIFGWQKCNRCLALRRSARIFLPRARRRLDNQSYHEVWDLIGLEDIQDRNMTESYRGHFEDIGFTIGTQFWNSPEECLWVLDFRQSFSPSNQHKCFKLCISSRNI